MKHKIILFLFALVFYTLPSFSSQVFEIKEQVERRTVSSKTYQIGKNSFKTVIYNKPVHYRNSIGAWEEIKLQLKPHQDGYTNQTNTIKTSFYSDKIVLGNENPVILSDFSSTNKSESKLLINSISTAADSEIKYLSQDGNETVSFSISNNSVLLFIDLNEVKVPGKISFKLSLPGNYTYRLVGNSLQISDEYNKVIYTVSKPVLFDNNKSSGSSELILSPTGKTVEVTIPVPSGLNNGRLLLEILGHSNIPPQLVEGGVYKEYVNGSYSFMSTDYFPFVGRYTINDTTYDDYKCYHYYDLSAITDNGVIDSAQYKVYKGFSSASISVSMYQMSYQWPNSATNLWNDCSNGNNYGSFDTDDNNPLFDETFSSYDDFCQDIENKLSSDWFGVGFDGSSSSGYADLHSYQVNGDLTIYYHDPYERFEVTVTNSFGSGTFLLEFQGQVNQYTAPKTFTFFHGDFIRLEAQNQQSGNYFRVFNDWEMDYVPQNSGISIEHIVTTDVGFEAVFKKRYDITFENEFMNGGSGGDIIVDDTTWSAPKLKYVVEDNNVTAEAPTQDLDVNGKNITYNFLEWQDGNTSNPRTFAPNNHSNYTAIYKGNLASNNATATAYNNGRRLVRASSAYHLVYEDNGDIYYTKSTDGTNWTKDFMISHSGGLCKNPSISRGIGGTINIIWELHEQGGTVKILFRRRFWDSSWSGIKWCMNFTQTHDARPVIAAHGDGSFLVVVCEGPDGLYYGSSEGSSSVPVGFSKVPTTNQYSVFPYGGFPSVQATTYPCGLAWEESFSKIYYMKFTHSNGVITWDTGSRTQIGSGSYPSVEGDYDNSPGPDYYTIAYQGHGDYNYIPLRVYRSRTETYSTFESWLKFHQRPSLFSDQSTNTEYSLVWYEGFGNDVLQSNYTNNQWSSPSALSSDGRHPTINSGNGYGGALSGPSTAVWADGGSSPYLIKTTSTGLSKATSSALTCLRRVEIDLSFLNPEISEGSIAGNVTLDLFHYKTGGEEKPFEPVREKSDRKKFWDSQPFSLAADTLEVQYMLKISDFEVNGKIDKNVLKKKLFHFNLNSLHSQLASINTITLQDLVDFNLTDFYIKNTIELDLSRLKGKTGYIEGEWPKQVTPTLTEVYIIGEADSLYRGISKVKAIEFIETQDQIDVVPESFVLFQNYPNPFNPVTHIVFDLPEDSNVKLTVYTINGELVQNLVNGHKPAGRYEIDFDGSHLSSGIYIYRIQAGKFSQAKRMLLIK